MEFRCIVVWIDNGIGCDNVFVIGFTEEEGGKEMNKEMTLDEFVIRGAEAYITLKEQFPNDKDKRVDLTMQINEYISLQCRDNPQQRTEYMAMYYRLRGEPNEDL